MQEQDISFVSLGLVVLDEIRIPTREPLTYILGGSGSYGESTILYQVQPHPRQFRPLVTPL